MWHLVGFSYPHWITMHGQPHIRFIRDVLSKLTNLMHKFLFYNNFIIFLYMFRALSCSSSGGQIIWYRHTERSEWSKITKIQFYKFEYVVANVLHEFFGCDYCMFLHCCIIQFDFLMMSTTVIETCRWI